MPTERNTIRRTIVIEIEAAANVSPRRLATVVRSVIADSTDDWLREHADLTTVRAEVGAARR